MLEVMTDQHGAPAEPGIRIGFREFPRVSVLAWASEGWEELAVDSGPKVANVSCFSIFLLLCESQKVSC